MRPSRAPFRPGSWLAVDGKRGTVSANAGKIDDCSPSLIGDVRENPTGPAGRLVRCEICGETSYFDKHNLVIHALHDRIVILEGLQGLVSP